MGAEKWCRLHAKGVAKAALEASVRYMAADLGADGIASMPSTPAQIKTLAASGIGDFRYILRWTAQSPMQRNVTIERSAGPASTCCPIWPPRHREVHHVDCGLSHRRYENPSAPTSPSQKADPTHHVAHKLRPFVPGYDRGESHGPASGGVVRWLPTAAEIIRGRQSSPGSTSAAPAHRNFHQRQEPIRSGSCRACSRG